MRAVIVLVAVLACAAPTAAQKAVDITQSYMAGIHLGASQVQARALMTKPVRLDRLEDGYRRLVSTSQKLESDLPAGTQGLPLLPPRNPHPPPHPRLRPLPP